jgi:hypothetical protein
MTLAKSSACSQRYFSFILAVDVTTTMLGVSMSSQLILIDGVKLLVEVDDAPNDELLTTTLTDEKPVQGREPTSAGSREKLQDCGESLRNVLRAVVNPIQDVLEKLPPDEWTLELSLGFKGEAGIPCLTRGEANGSIRLSIKWKE